MRWILKLSLYALLMTLSWACKLNQSSGEKFESSTRKQAVNDPTLIEGDKLVVKELNVRNQKIGEHRALRIDVVADEKADYVEFFICTDSTPKVCRPGPDKPEKMLEDFVLFPDPPVGLITVVARACVYPKNAKDLTKLCGLAKESKFNQIFTDCDEYCQALKNQRAQQNTLVLICERIEEDMITYRDAQSTLSATTISTVDTNLTLAVGTEKLPAPLPTKTSAQPLVMVTTTPDGAQTQVDPRLIESYIKTHVDISLDVLNPLVCAKALQEPRGKSQLLVGTIIALAVAMIVGGAALIWKGRARGKVEEISKRGIGDPTYGTLQKYKGEFDNTLKDLTRQLGDKDKNIAALQADLDKKRAELNALKAKRGGPGSGSNFGADDEEIRKRTAEINALRDELGQLRDSIDRLKQLIGDLERQIANLNSQIDADQARLNQMLADADRLQREINGIRDPNEKINAEIDRLKNLLLSPVSDEVLKAFGYIQNAARAPIYKFVDDYLKAWSKLDKNIKNFPKVIQILEQKGYDIKSENFKGGERGKFDFRYQAVFNNLGGYNGIRPFFENQNNIEEMKKKYGDPIIPIHQQVLKPKPEFFYNVIVGLDFDTLLWMNELAAQRTPFDPTHKDRLIDQLNRLNSEIDALRNKINADITARDRLIYGTPPNHTDGLNYYKSRLTEAQNRFNDLNKWIAELEAKLNQDKADLATRKKQAEIAELNEAEARRQLEAGIAKKQAEVNKAQEDLGKAKADRDRIQDDIQTQNKLKNNLISEIETTNKKIEADNAKLKVEYEGKKSQNEIDFKAEEAKVEFRNKERIAKGEIQEVRAGLVGVGTLILLSGVAILAAQTTDNLYLLNSSKTPLEKFLNSMKVHAAQAESARQRIDELSYKIYGHIEILFD